VPRHTSCRPKPLRMRGRRGQCRVPVRHACDEATQRLAIYYGAADTVTAMAFGYVSELVEFAKEHSIAG